MRANLIRSAINALVIVLLCGLIALIFNTVRPNGIAIIATSDYQILVPCPEPGGPVQILPPSDPAVTSASTFLIDARNRSEYNKRHLETAVNVGFDWLDPIPDEILNQLAIEIASSRVTRVVVYGDGGLPDSGEYLGKEISGRGIKNVFFLDGGAPAAFAGADE